MRKYRHRSSFWRRLSRTVTGPSQERSDIPRGLGYQRKTKYKEYLRALERELTLCKRAMAVSTAREGDTMSSQVEAYRSLWYMSDNRAKELEELLVKYVDESVLRPILPYHHKFRSFSEDSS